MRALVAWCLRVLEDERNEPSSKRIAAFLALAVLLFIAIAQVVGPLVLALAGKAATVLAVDPEVVHALTFIVLGGLGLASIDKFSPRAKVEAEVAKARASQQLSAIPERDP
jgi:hypothetical protein